MKKIVLLKLASFAVLLASPTMAQEVTLKVTNQDLGIIGKALGTQPYNEVFPLMTKLQAQIVEQQKAAEQQKVPVIEQEKKPDEPKK